MYCHAAGTKHLEGFAPSVRMTYKLSWCKYKVLCIVMQQGRSISMDSSLRHQWHIDFYAIKTKYFVLSSWRKEGSGTKHLEGFFLGSEWHINCHNVSTKYFVLSGSRYEASQGILPYVRMTYRFLCNKEIFCIVRQQVRSIPGDSSLWSVSESTKNLVIKFSTKMA